MRTIASALLTHIQGSDVNALAICWAVTRQDGIVLRGTEHDRDITIDTGALAGTYLATAGFTASTVKTSDNLSVDNLEVQGALSLSFDIDLTEQDIEAGLLNDAPVSLFIVHFNSPNDGQYELRVGHLGNIRRKHDGSYTAELRGITQRLRQTVVRTYGVLCDADLGDARCGINLASVTVTGTVASVTDNKTFGVTLDQSPQPALGLYSFGVLSWDTGSNAGLGMEVRQDSVGSVLGAFELYEAMPYDVQVGDTFSVTQGCVKTLARCIQFGNVVNFRGYGVYIPGRNKVTQYGQAT